MCESRRFGDYLAEKINALLFLKFKGFLFRTGLRGGSGGSIYVIFIVYLASYLGGVQVGVCLGLGGSGSGDIVDHILHPILSF